ncbi:FxsB family radical SAM/SPASM domain protein [Thermocatellispora tengchongensis]
MPGVEEDRPAPSGEPLGPGPFRVFVLKIHGRCDLSCDYCYVYRGADRRWARRPVVMPRQVAERAAARIAEHVRRHALPAVRVVLHGGEPLLCRPEQIEHVVRRVRAEVGGDARVRVQMQTNGVRLGEVYLRLLDRLDVHVGVSLDGGPSAHDRHRRTASGRGSHEAVAASLARLRAEPYRHLYDGLLCVVDLDNDPVATYEALLEHEPPAVDFLLPHATWTTPPPGRAAPGATPYADWLGAVFRRWYGAERKETRVRFLEEIINLLLGGTSALGTLGRSAQSIAVVETDGGIELSDQLKVAFEGAGDTGLNVLTDPFDAVSALPQAAVLHPAAATLCPTCAACDLVRVCGGGDLAHRYRRGGGFANPSVYCPDLYALIGEIRDRLTRDVAALRAAPG